MVKVGFDQPCAILDDSSEGRLLINIFVLVLSNIASLVCMFRHYRSCVKTPEVGVAAQEVHEVDHGSTQVIGHPSDAQVL